MAVEFCHIAPIKHLDLVEARPVHLVLAHLVEQDETYCNFYLEQKEKFGCTIILDNSAFEMYKQGKPMYPSDKLISMATLIKADYIVMSDYPAEHADKTIQQAIELAPLIHDAGFKTFFCPQSEIGQVKQLVNGYRWAAQHPNLVDYVGVSILSAPNAYGVEKSNKLQRFNSRLRLMYEMRDSSIMPTLKHNGTKVHFLGMVDGPNEVMFMSPFGKYIDTWDSSAAIWAGLNGIRFDHSPTGLLDGKFETEVDFHFHTEDHAKIAAAITNMRYIDTLCYSYIWR